MYIRLAHFSQIFSRYFRVYEKVTFVWYVLKICFCITLENFITFLFCLNLFMLTKYAVPRLISSNLCGSKMDAKICSSNANIISFIDNGDIWVANMVTGLEMRLTFLRMSGRDDTISAGVPAHVMQEEFDRFTGYWWEPRKEQDMEG